MAQYKDVKIPTDGAKITLGANRKLSVPDNPIIPFIEGDGTGRDIWRASARVFDASVQKAYGGKKKIHWMEVYAGEKSFKLFKTWLPRSPWPAASADINKGQGIKAKAGYRRIGGALRRSLS